MKVLTILSAIALLLFSALLFFNGAVAYLSTFGTVRGTEFQMQIEIVSQLGLILIWLAVFTLWSVLRSLTNPS